LPRDLFEDESLADPKQLLTQYRQLCKALGAAQATGTSVTRETIQQIAHIEAELQTRLWLAANGDGASSQATVTGPKSPTTSDKRQVTKTQAPEPRTQSQIDATHHSSLITHHSDTSGTATVYSDGACIGNPGPGGYGAIVRVPGHPEKTLSDGKARTTNNEMEMTGAIEGLKAAVSLGAGDVTVFTDSEYLVKGMNSWMKGWLRNGWKTRTGDPVKNRELWEELHRLTQGRAVTWTWVAGHAGHPENERCDSLAVAAAQQAANRAKR
jgi:ribonuclease HI